MRARLQVLLALTLWLGSATGAAYLTVTTWSAHAAPFADTSINATRDLVVGAVFAGVGLVLAAKRPRNVVGWLLYGVAISLSFNVLLVRYAVYGLLERPGALPGAAVAGALGASAWIVLISSLALLLLTFPHGRLPSRRWRFVVWALLAVDVSVWAGNTLSPERLGKPLAAHVNPLGIGALRSAGAALSVPGWVIIVVFMAAAVSLGRRFRRAHGEERQQYKWFTFASALFPVILLVVQVGDQLFGETSMFDTIGSSISALVAAIIPVATAVAVLRYRLYDIDQVISRTLAYAALTLILGASYAGLVLGGQAVFSSFAGGSNLAVALSTLVVAAVFFPLRSRVQSAVDRRFYRRRYDAQRTLDHFAAQLRNEVELDLLEAHLSEVVREVMQPSAVTVWLASRNASVTPVP
jgi:hypothetical protein